jgi:hypothetical protein
LTCVVICFWGLGMGNGRLIQKLIDAGYALTSTYAGGYHAILLLAAAQLINDLHGELGACAGQWMAEGDGASVHVHDVRIDVQLADDTEALGGEGLVQFDQINLIEMGPMPMMRGSMPSTP